MSLGICFEEVTGGLWDYGFKVVAVSFDGAAENVGLMRHFTEMVHQAAGPGHSRVQQGFRARDFLSPADVAKWAEQGRDLEYFVAFPHPRDRSLPVFPIADMPHFVKTLRNSLSDSGWGIDENYRDHGSGLQEQPDIDPLPGQGNKKPLKRDLKVPRKGTEHQMPAVDTPFNTLFDVMNLRMNKRVADLDKADGYHDLSSDTKFKSEHWELTRNTKMRVYLAIQVCASQAIRDKIEIAEKKGMPPSHGSLSTARNLPGAQNYASMKAMVSHVDRLVDIFNTRNTHGCMALRNANETQLQELLDVYDWFHEWKKALALRVVNGTLTEREATSSFIPRETWNKIESLTLGTYCMASYFLTRFNLTGTGGAKLQDKTYLPESPGRALVLRRLLNDVVE